MAGGTCGNMMTHVEVWWDEIKYSVCSRPFMRPREARQVRDGYGTGMGRICDGYGMGMGRVWDGYGTGMGRV